MVERETTRKTVVKYYKIERKEMQQKETRATTSARVFQQPQHSSSSRDERKKLALFVVPTGRQCVLASSVSQQ
jgi:hypothetical protein